ncbi:hypothetical protein [Chryseobacterium angstadtii]|uniref:hypothetical protein n=1 Tax=Chryseobacterium angstadtii TaxID=558151 RepID=UPI0010394BD2|nr:hypothetical protein [Chryseobacterium angstadtii]
MAFFLIPSIGFACSKKEIKTETASCSTKPSKKDTDEKSCCKPKSCSDSKKHHDCNGGCKDCSCRCSTILPALGLPSVADLKIKKHFSEEGTLKFVFKQPYYPSANFSIWQPPKIG